VKLSPVLINYAPRHEDLRRSGGIAPTFLTSTVDAADAPAALPPREHPPRTQCVGDWVASIAGQDAIKKRKSLLSLPRIETRLVGRITGT
jgi:hypothetical protein